MVTSGGNMASILGGKSDGIHWEEYPGRCKVNGAFYEGVVG